jgi:hypothetical protein
MNIFVVRGGVFALHSKSRSLPGKEDDFLHKEKVVTEENHEETDVNEAKGLPSSSNIWKQFLLLREG